MGVAIMIDATSNNNNKEIETLHKDYIFECRNW